MRSFPEIAATLGIELVKKPVQSREEVAAIVAQLPRDAAVFAVPAPSLEPVSSLLDAAIARHIPVAAQIDGYATKGALLTYGPSLFAMGKQAGRLADQIFKGAKPADLPVETSEYFLEINLRTAKLIGLDIGTRPFGRRTTSFADGSMRARFGGRPRARSARPPSPSSL
jgi:putative ABC transport system substrate-binding protein